MYVKSGVLDTIIKQYQCFENHTATVKYLELFLVTDTLKQNTNVSKI